MTTPCHIGGSKAPTRKDLLLPARGIIRRRRRIDIMIVFMVAPSD
jgi:hypothetical protein